MSELLAFKVAFINRCAEEGLTLNQINDRVKTAVANAEARYGTEKKAAWFWPLMAGMGLANLKDAIGAVVPPSLGALAGFAVDPSLAGAGTGAALGGMRNYVAPLAIGGAAALAGGGLLIGKSLASTQENPDATAEIKHKELINEYARLADRTTKATRRRRLLENRG